MSSTGLHSSDITSKSSFWISVDADANVIGFMLASLSIVVTSYGFLETIINIKKLFLYSDLIFLIQ
jgi:hypothetical protein